MFHRFATSVVYAFLAFTVLAAAMPGGHPPPTTTTVVTPPHTTTVTITATAPGSTTTIPASQCNTGDIQCCDSVQKASSGAVGLLLGLLGVVLQDLNVLVGVTCSPLTIIGGGGSSCTAQPVCCENNTFGGIIAIGCSPININL
ncbi:fungal hydrophobin-domain-containing protein [Collybia nuda]|uniref:Hydrophobin n=1 Tax=Collybia nuda TaxID=64659 RepID=A0A9P5YHD9_9AGAR|nr:fungal hydrophobin-domain-containing protein [Collybia nuda]